jgi:hypothetical protein
VVAHLLVLLYVLLHDFPHVLLPLFLHATGRQLLKTRWPRAWGQTRHGRVTGARRVTEIGP